MNHELIPIDHTRPHNQPSPHTHPFHLELSNSQDEPALPQTHQLLNMFNLTSKQLKKLFFIGPYISILLIWLASFYYFFLKDRTSPQSINTVLLTVSENMSRSPISDLHITKDNCPSEYNLETLGEWPGTVHGCFSSKSNAVAAGNCDDNNEGIGVQEVPAVSITNWNGWKFCVKRYSNEAYEQTARCIQGYRSCGNSMCVLEDQKCPITGISWYKEKSMVKDIKENVLMNEDEGIFVSVERSNARKPVISFAISYNTIPCLDNNSVPFTENLNPLLDLSYGCSYGQNFETVQITTESEQKILSDINISPLLNHYSENSTVYLVGLERFRVKQEEDCSDPAVFNIMKEAIKTSNKLSIVRNMFLLILFFAVFMASPFIIETLKTLENPNEESCFKNMDRGLHMFSIALVLFLFSALNFLIIRNKIGKLIRYQGSLDGVIEQRCFMNPFINSALTDFKEGPLLKAEFFYWDLMMITMLSAMPVVVIWLERYKKKRRE